MNAMTVEIAKVALNAMMARGWCDICVIRKILEMTGSVPQREDLQALELLHCVSFVDFTPTMRKEFPALLQRVLESEPMTLSIKFVAQPREPLALMERAFEHK